ncbi:MAG: hypothetical protein QOJ70_2811 [Acidobacteriota bacterium]|jgi:tetratricopeptide (TPR) repeat protein|nr:hypothetical protein [Acidobacteriota bacterium]
MGFDKAKAIRAAEKYLAQSKIPSAIQEYTRIVEHEADDFNALNTLGDLYARVERRDEAVSCYRRVAEHYREQGFTLKAVAMYKKLSRFVPDDHKTALALASLYEQQGLLIDARQQYLVAADVFARSGDSREALDVLRRIADLDPSNTQIRLRLAESFARENLPDLAAEAYTEAGARLAARKEFESALGAFVKALALRPASHAALHGLLAAHTALGTADEAAEVLEQAVKERPGDMEVRAMLARAYVDAEDASRAEVATHALVASDPSSFMLFYDVARLFLRQGATDDATRLLVWVAEPSLAAHQESQLAELLHEVLARDPEQMEAHHLLVRAYTSAREDAKLRAALERLADAAETTGDVEEERHALTRLVRLAPDDRRSITRLEALGGPLFEEGESTSGVSDEAPTFESFMLDGDAVRASAATPAVTSAAAEFEWNSVAETPSAAAPAADASASFADLNDLTDEADGAAVDAPPVYREQSPQAGYQEFDFNAPVPHNDAAREQTQGAGVERMLRQELEGVDFYIEQGYADIARDTLDGLERQYGPSPEIEALRGRLATINPTSDFGTSETFDAAASFDNVTAFETPTVYATQEPATFEAVAAFETPAAFDEALADNGATGVANSFNADVPSSPPPPPPQKSAANNSQPNTAQQGGIDPGLAAIFDEFREAVEDTGEEDADGDFDTHYQMGLAYREMGLLDLAVEEFQSAVALAAPADGTPRFLQSCNMLGHCFMEKGMPSPAALWFKRGLAAPGHTEDEYQAMRYDLGTAYERMGDNGRAIEVLSEVYAIDVSYRGVAERLRELQRASK